MTESEHQRSFESLGAYALGALPDAERAAVAAHIETCPVCAEDAASLQSAATNLIETVPMLEPPPELRGRIMAVVESEAALLRAASGSPDRAKPAPRRRASWSGPLTARVAMAAAALLVVGGLIGALAPFGGGGSSTRTLSANAQRAWVEVKDGRAQLVVNGLAAPPSGKVYEAWVQHGNGKAQSAALFVVRKGRVDLPGHATTGDRYMVTAEPPGGSPQPTSTPIVVTQRL